MKQPELLRGILSKKEKPYHEDFASNLGSGTVGLIGAAAFGPAGALLGALGAPLGKSIVREGIISYVIKKLFPKRSLVAVLKHKLEVDFVQSCLDDSHSMSDALASSISILKIVGMIRSDSSEKRILRNNELLSVRNLLLSQEQITDLATHLKPLGTIKISCTSIHAATVCVFKALAARLLPYGINLEISFEDINGHYQVLTSKKNYFDIAVFPNDAFFMVENAAETAYRLMFTINCQIQYLFHRKTKNIGNNSKDLIHVYQDSSAHMHYLLGKGIPKYSESRIIEKIDDFPSVIQEMNGGEMIIVWEPLANLLYDNSDFELVPNSRYKIWNSLYCNKTWNKPSMRRAREAFNILFVNEWRLCKTNKRMATDLLLQDEEYLMAFSKGAGILIR